MNALQTFSVLSLTLQVQSAVSQLQSSATWVPHSQVNVDDLTPGLTFNGENYYIGRTSYFGSVIPGTVYSTRNTFYFGSGGRERNSANYELLVYSCSDFTWIRVEATNSTYLWPNNLFPAGAYGGNQNETLYVCRAWHVTGTTTAHRLGKFSKLKKTCDVPFWGGEYSYWDFEVFAVVPPTKQGEQSGGDQTCPCTSSADKGYFIALIVSMSLLPIVAIVAFITGKRFSNDRIPVSLVES